MEACAGALFAMVWEFSVTDDQNTRDVTVGPCQRLSAKRMDRAGVTFVPGAFEPFICLLHPAH